ncbi:MAG: heme-copper oxidase subunit III [candidate division KSB1 bacterium]|nr:heme-copper oxidase subunit III [candidate division KSB1 bacterium]MDZ7367666.1 heme-copper oxidase subunit III [candidate division KSB1 bacterium]MDZ7404819.1 heme-copper oxidase subunit III [candidate division KSB1 bacterium]
MENTFAKNLFPASNGTFSRAGAEDRALPNVELPINGSVLGLLIFLGTEAMFFAGLISAFLILRAGGGVWPPAGQPRLPVEVTAINTLILLFSAYTMHRATLAVRSDNQKTLVNWLAVTGALGTIFLGVQGTEWLRLVNYGLTLTSGNYGATFYTLIGAHGLHVLAAVIVLSIVFTRALSKKYSAQNFNGLELCRLYWFFVVGIWPLLYGLVYLG